MTTTGDLLTLSAAAATTATGLQTITAAALTTGYAMDINVNGATSLTSGGAINIDGPTGAAAQAAGSLLKISTTGAVTGTDGSGNSFQISTATATGTVASISSSGTMTTTGDLLTLSAAAATTATGMQTITAAALTTGYAMDINVNGATSLTSGGAINIDGPTGAAAQAAGSLLLISTTGAVTGTDGSGNSLQVNSATATGTVASISSSGTMTTTGDLLTLTANNATTATGLLTIDGGNTMTTGSALSITGTTYVHGAETGSLASFAFSDTTSGAVASTTNGILVTPTINITAGAATKTINGVAINPTFTACTTATCSVSGLSVGNVTDSGNFNSTAIVTGTGWDTGINVGSGNVTIAAGQSYTGAGAVTLSSTTNTLTLDSGNNILTLAAGDTTLQRTAAGTYTFDLVDAADTTLFLANSTGTAGVDLLLRIDSLTNGGAGCDTIDTTADGTLICGTDAGAGASPFGAAGGVITKTTGSDFVSLQYGDAADTQLVIENTTSGTVPTVDAAQITLTGGTTGIVTADADALQIAWEAGHMTAGGSIAGINLALTTVAASTTSADIFNGLNISNITGTTATENAVNLGTGWDTLFAGTTAGTSLFNFTNFDVTTGGDLDLTGTITAGSSNTVLTLSTGLIDADALTLTAAADAGTGTSSGSGLIARSDGIGLLQGCTDGQVLAWEETTDTWDCTTAGGGGDAGLWRGSRERLHGQWHLDQTVLCE